MPMPRWRKFCRYGLDLLQLTAADAEQELDEMEIIQANRDKKRRKSDFFYVVVAAFVVVLGYGLMQLMTPDFSQNSRAMEQASNSVVAVNCFDQAGNLVAGGSGFLAFEPGIIVTNLHLAQMGYEIIAITKQGEKFLVNMVINYDADKDIVLLRSSELYLYDDENLQLLQPGPNQLTQQDDIVVAISS
ncbi:MAG: S1C family serine protease, partial [Clostridiales bacterium]